jgi:hypothetical protein
LLAIAGSERLCGRTDDGHRLRVPKILALNYRQSDPRSRCLEKV